jgi:hypothetical protein
VRLRGFCCSRGRGECFLIYDFVPNGNLLRYLDVKDGDGHVLEWSTRVSIVRGIARGQFSLVIICISESFSVTFEGLKFQTFEKSWKGLLNYTRLVMKDNENVL